MSDCIRYEQTGYDRGMQPAAEGDWVYFSDHAAALAAERERANALVAEAVAKERDRCAMVARMAMMHNADADELTCSIIAAAIREGGE